MNNVRQLSLASLIYAGENGKHPCYENPSYPGGTWMGTLTDELKGKNVRVCPTTALQKLVPFGRDLQGAADTAWIRWTADRTTMFQGSYGFNGWLYSDGKVDGETADIHRDFFFDKDTSVQKPAQTPLFFDENWVDTWPLESDVPSSNLYAGSPFYDHHDEIGRCTITRHNCRSASNASRRFAIEQPLPGGINMGFTDGHVQMVKLEDLWKFSWHRDWQIPTLRPR